MKYNFPFTLSKGNFFFKNKKMLHLLNQILPAYLYVELNKLKKTQHNKNRFRNKKRVVATEVGCGGTGVKGEGKYD